MNKHIKNLKTTREEFITDESSDQKGVMLLLNQNLASCIRLPMLEVICDQFARLASNSLRNYTANAVDMQVTGLRGSRFGETMHNMKEHIVSIFKSEELNNIGLLTIDKQLIYSLVDVLFGGRKILPSVPLKERPLTSIEMVVVRNLSELLLLELGRSFQQLEPIQFALDRVETNPQLAMLLRPEEAVVAIELEITIDQRQGSITLLLPHTTLEPIKSKLTQSYISNKGRQDLVWKQHITHEIAHSKVKLEVMLSRNDLLCKDAAELSVGKTIMLDKSGDSPWSVLINQIKIANAALGRVGDNIAITLLSDEIKATSEVER